MTRDETIRMVREALDTDKVDAWSNDFWVITQEEIERFAALVAAAQREACAKVCEDYNDDGGSGEAWAGRFAAAIRARRNNAS